MKQIFKNKYLKSWCFNSPKEGAYFIDNQSVENKLFIEDTYGPYYYCYICFDSLTNEKKFVITFNSYQNEENLSFLFWDEVKMFVLNGDENIYFIDYSLNVKFSLEITSSLIGLHLVRDDKLLIMQETCFKVVDVSGEILSQGSFDLALSFHVEEDALFIRSSNGINEFNLW